MKRLKELFLKNNNTYVINVTVKEDISEELLNAIDRVSEGNTVARVLDETSEERQSIVAKARNMTNVAWTPTKTLIGWKGKYTFEAGKVYTGVPYSQTEYQCDEEDFLAAMNSSDFYSSYTRTINGVTNVMPKYGSDCSGFVSFAWGISRVTTATLYTYPSIGGYENLQAGDAVVYRVLVGDEWLGHAMLVSTNFQTPPEGSGYSEPYVVCYEQNKDKALVSFHTYTSLTNNNYKAISKFSN